MNNPTLTEFCFGMIGRADIEGSKSNVAMNAWLPQASSVIPQLHQAALPLWTSAVRTRCHTKRGSLCRVGVARTLRCRLAPHNLASVEPPSRSQVSCGLSQLSDCDPNGLFHSPTRGITTWPWYREVLQDVPASSCVARDHPQRDNRGGRTSRQKGLPTGTVIL